MTFKNNGVGMYPEIILHDCFIDSIYIDKKDLIFTFDDNGFYKRDDGSHTYYRTQAGKIKFVNTDLSGITIQQNKNINIFGLHYQRVIDIDPYELMDCINSEQCRICIVDEFYATGSIYLTYSLFKNSKHYSGSIELSFDSMMYYWGDINYEKPW